MADGSANPLVAREHELALALRAVRFGAGVVVMGDAGVGKTSLARRVSEQLGADGEPVVWTVATQTGRGVPFGTLGPLLPDDSAALPPALLPPAIIRALRERAGRRRVLLVVDDAHWLDEHSANALLAVVTQQAATVLATVRSGTPPPDAVTALWKDGLLERADVDVLDLDATRRLLAGRLGGEVANLTVAMLWEHTRGNPLYLAELIRFGLAEGRFDRDGSLTAWRGELGVPPRLAQLLDRRFAGLSAPARDVVGALALGEPLPLDVLAAVASGEAVEEVEERGLVGAEWCAGVDRLRLAHPLLTAAATRTLTPTRRRRLVTVLSAVAGAHVDAVRGATWQLDAPDPPDVDVLLAGAAAVQLTDPALAGRFAQRALPHDPGPRAALALSDSHAELGHPGPAREAMRTAAARVRTDDERLAVAAVDASLTTWSERDPQRALADLTALRDELPSRFAADLDSQRALITMFCARPRDALLLAERVAGKPAQQAAIRAAIPRICALTLADRGRAAGEVGSRALAAIEGARVGPYTVGQLHAMVAWSRLMSWTAGPRRAPGVAAGRWPVRQPDSPAPPDASVAWPLLDGLRWHIEGRLADAAPLLHEALVEQRRGEGVFRSEVTTGLAVVLAETGAADAAARLLDTAPADPVAVIPHGTTWARSALAAARDDRVEATRLALRAAAGAAEAGAVITALWYLADAGRYGEPVRAERLLHTLGETFESPLSQARAAGIRARAAAAPRELLAAAEQHAAIGVLGQALDLAQRAASAPGRDGAVQRARAALLADDLRARLNLAAPAARPAVALTAREAEIARLAARKLSNREIAGTLVVSQRTVETHLVSVYRKLGVRSRAELGDVLTGD